MVETSPNAKPIDRWLGLLATAVGVALYLLPKTEPVIIGCCALIWAFLIHPAIRFWWIEDRKWRQVLALLILTGGVVLLGLRVQPEHPYGTATDRAGNVHASTQPARNLIELRRDEAGAVTSVGQTPAMQRSARPSQTSIAEAPRSKKSRKAATGASPPTRIVQTGAGNVAQTGSSSIAVTAPNGIAIGPGASAINPSVTNTFSDVFPHPGVIPTVTMCVTPLNSIGQAITIRTDTPITAPYWWFAFDSPVSGSSIELVGAKEPYGSTHGPPTAEQAAIVHVPVDHMVGVQITAIGNPFGGPWRPFDPTDTIRVTVTAEHPLKIAHVEPGSVRRHLDEKIVFACDSQ